MIQIGATKTNRHPILSEGKEDMSIQSFSTLGAPGLTKRDKYLYEIPAQMHTSCINYEVLYEKAHQGMAERSNRVGCAIGGHGKTVPTLSFQLSLLTTSH